MFKKKSTALAQREEECRGWPNGHPGMRAGEAPLTRLACHAGYKGGGDSVERGDASSLDGWRPSPDLERCCKSAQYSFPPVTSSRYVTLPVTLNGQTFRYPGQTGICDPAQQLQLRLGHVQLAVAADSYVR